MPVPGSGLSFPTGGVGPLGAAYAGYLARTAAAFGELGPLLAAPLRPAHAAATDALRAALGKDKRAALQALASPVLGAAVHAAPLAPALPELAARIEAATAAATAHLLLELAARSALDRELAFPAAPRLLSPALGVALATDAGSWRFRGGAIAAGDGPWVELAALGDGAPGLTVERPYLRVGPTRLALEDGNPLARFEAHPDKAGNALDLGGRTPEAWAGALAPALDAVAFAAPELVPELSLLLHQLVPVGFHEERHLSASYREAIGTVYLTLHPSTLTLVEAIVHEFQHNKANALAHGGDLLENAFHPLYKSPVRPDPRPLWGILLAVHAFLPVAHVLRRLRDRGHPLAAQPGFASRLGDIDLKNREGMDMLRAHARFTPAGRALFDDLEALERAHMAERAAAGLPLAPQEVHLA